ncbi:helix-turn-helix domain-containing protein [Emticicia sp. CRIBPO]|uniref:GlxA family transcriptional regulator n=1 Tax=Emticicia sp. CRIBPO TaxID=2683258 RepID=UPI0014127103|nr:helix-turn-helix domain-containing protein [Emticicia sp. CRIBPO]NBA84612.1 helix-turn-helix domain-containing protein [Emticicia sp. CRIBPO]
MKHISILIPQGAILGSLEGSRQLLTQVNNFFRMRGQEPLFNVQLVGITKETPLSGGSFTANADLLIDEVKQTDLIIIPAVDGDLRIAIEKNKDFLPWIARQYQGGAEVASLCLGAFLLASTGLLDGKKCATHWLAANDFRKMFPEVELVEEKIITDEQGIYSSGGAFSYQNLILYLIGKYAGHEMAIMAAKVFAIEIDRKSQSPFIMFQGQREHEDETVRKAQAYIEEHFQDKITVDHLSDLLALNRRSLERRFKKATSNTVSEYIQRVKIEVAKKDFETTRKNIYEVMFEVGYSDVKAFRTIFRKTTGLSPVEYRNKYNKEVMVWG